MATNVIEAVWSGSQAEGTARLILLALADSAGRDTWECWPSVDTLASMAKVSRRSVQRATRELEKLGEVSMLPPMSGRKGNTYRVERAALGGVNLSPPPPKGVTPVTAGGDIQGTGGVTPVTPRGDTRDTQTVKEPSVEPSVEPYPLPPMTEDDEFEAWWGGYPNKQKKPRARKAWEVARKKNLPALPQVLQALAQHKRSDQWTRDGGRYVPHPATWLNEEMWADRLPESGDSAGNVRWQPDFAGIDVEAEMRRMLGNPL